MKKGGTNPTIIVWTSYVQIGQQNILTNKEKYDIIISTNEREVIYYDFSKNNVYFFTLL